MAREGKSDAPGFDMDGLRQLMEMMEKHDVTELKLEQSDAKYVLRRGPQNIIASAPAPVALPTAAPAPAPSATAPAPAASTDSSTSSDEGLLEIKSPTVGTFYQSPSPGDPAFVNVGDKVSPESVVCIVEAMKVFNQIPAEVSGTIAKTLLKDGDPVQYGQTLFLVKPN